MQSKIEIYEEFIRRIVVHADSMHDIAREIANIDLRYPGIFDDKEWFIMLPEFIRKYK